MNYISYFFIANRTNEGFFFLFAVINNHEEEESGK